MNLENSLTAENRASDLFADGDYDKRLGIFSKEHLNYLLCRDFQILRADVSAENMNNCPIIWNTGGWRQREFVGQAVRLSFNPRSRIPPALPENRVALVGNYVAGFNRSDGLDMSGLNETVDNFWDVVNSVSNVRFSAILSLKVLISMIFDAGRDGREVSLLPSTVRNEFMKVGTSSGKTLIDFWDDAQKACTWCKIHLFGSTGHKKMQSNTSLMYLRRHYLSDSTLYKHEWNKAMRGVSRDEILRCYEKTTQPGEVFETPDFPVVSGYTLLEDSRINGVIASSTLGDAVKVSCDTGIITPQLLEELFIFRARYQENRQQYGLAVQNSTHDRSEDVERIKGCNMQLAVDFGFNGKKGVMQLNHHAVKRRRAS